MENLTNWEIVGIIVLVLIFGGVIWRIAKKLFIVAVVAILLLIGTYSFKPEILYDWFGEDNVEWVAGKFKSTENDLKKKTNELANEFKEDLDN